MQSPLPGDRPEPIRQKVLTRVGGEVAIPPSLRKKLAYLEDGTVLVCSANSRDPDVVSFLHLQRNQRVFIRVEEVSFTRLADIYADKIADGNSQGTNAQALQVREIVTTAAKRHASDIHWVSMGEAMSILFRVDGSLERYQEVGADFGEDLLRAVYNAHTSAGDGGTQLQLNEDQDGRITSRALLPGDVSAVRISSGPMAGGFQQVWRLIYDNIVASADLRSLGYTTEQVEILDDVARLPHGIIIFGGPTGSGKSTSLQTTLTAHYKRTLGKLHIYTIEEPVEMPMPGVRQHSTATTSESDEDRASAFIAAVRVMLRRDPNIVMFGEIRDVITASLAVRVAIAGRLLYATLHGNGAMDLLLRLVTELQVAPMLATDHNLFVCFVSQSLVPILCQACSITAAEVLASGHHEHARRHVERILTSTGIERTRFIGRGCAQCENKGTVGRELVAEVIRTNSEIMDAIRTGDKAAAMLSWLAEGNQTKRMVALDKAKQGLIDPLIAERHVGELAVLDRNGKPKPLRDVLSYGYRVAALEDVDDATRGPG